MILRSGRLLGIDNICIDFDLASKLWRKNKKYCGNGIFRYKKK